VAADDHVPLSTEAADVDLDAAPGEEAALVDAELPVDVDRLAGVFLQEREERLGKAWVVSGVVAAPRALAGAAEEVAGVVLRDESTAAAAGADLFRSLVHGASVGSARGTG
jgi:hypothetical protein